MCLLLCVTKGDMKGYVRELAEVDRLYFDTRSTLIYVVLDERKLGIYQAILIRS